MAAEPRRDVFPLRFKNPRKRDALRRLAELTGQSMTDVAERAIEHEVVLLAADLETRRHTALDVVHGYQQADGLDGWLDAAAAGETSDLGSGLRVPGSTEVGRASSTLVHGRETRDVRAAFSAG